MIYSASPATSSSGGIFVLARKLARPYGDDLAIFPLSKLGFRKVGVLAVQLVQPMKHCSSVGAAKKDWSTRADGKSDEKCRQIKFARLYRASLLHNVSSEYLFYSIDPYSVIQISSFLRWIPASW